MGIRHAFKWAGLIAVSLGLAGCGVSVAAGGENAATHPASGIFVATTNGGGNISERAPAPTAPYQPPSNTPPKSLPPGLVATKRAVEAAVSGGCWQDSFHGNLYGAYDQLFWWQGDCGDTVAGVTIELFPTAAAAKAAAHHPTANALLGRYLDGAVLVDVFVNAPTVVPVQLKQVRGLRAIPGYGF
ncbi:MAG TPA: hypothetical protein VME46_09175 [Acidimicrobiales bacterium]|nr:hypothetical protein [Acidimicrobiales bacterium]